MYRVSNGTGKMIGMNFKTADDAKKVAAEFNKDQQREQDAKVWTYSFHSQGFIEVA